MSPKNRLIVSILLFCVLLAVSFFKDWVTPDHYNTASAAFLKDHSPRYHTLATHPAFWTVAFLYSLTFIIFPALIIHVYFGQPELTRLVTLSLAGGCILMYVLLFCNNPMLDRAIIPKLNRYFHSPVILMFFVAAFKLVRRHE